MRGSATSMGPSSGICVERLLDDARALAHLFGAAHEAVVVVARGADRDVELEAIVDAGTGATCARRRATPVERRQTPVQPSASASSLPMRPMPSTRSRKMRFLRRSFSPSVDQADHAGDAGAHHLLEVGGGGLGHAADAAEAVRHPGARLLLEDVPDDLPRAGEVEERGEGAELHRHGAGADQVVADARQLAEDDAVVGAALGHGDAEHLLHREREADVVEHRRDVVEAVGVGEDLRPVAALAHLLEAAVQVADLHVGLADGLARELEDDAHRAVHGRVRRAHVEHHRLGRELELAFSDVEIQRFHQFSPRAVVVGLAPEAHALVRAEGGSLPSVPSRNATSGWILSAG